MKRLQIAPIPRTRVIPLTNPAADPAFRNHGSCAPPNQALHIATSIACAPAKVSNPIANAGFDRRVNRSPRAAASGNSIGIGRRKPGIRQV